MKPDVFVPSILAVLALAGTASAADWYVDAAHGSDSNSGSSPGEAWRTITHALATAPPAPAGGTQVIHVAPGTYGTSLGEVFPILLVDAFQIVGDQGSAATIVDGGGGAAIFRAWISHLGGNYVGPLTQVRGLTLQNAAVGADLSASTYMISLDVQDTRIHAMSSSGLRFVSSCGMGCGFASANLTRVSISGCPVGIDFVNVSTQPVGGIPTLRLVECDVSGNASTGVLMRSQATGGFAANLTRTRIHGNGADGVLLEIQNLFLAASFNVRILDCLVAGNGGSGVKSQAPSTSSGTTSVVLGIQGSTIAANAASGLDVFYDPANPWDPQHRTTLAGSILYGNLDDVRENAASPSISPVSYCNVGDGDFAGSNGNFSADPAFRNADGGDYRLSWGSPCIDTGDPAAPFGAPDVGGVIRAVDGNLDTVERADVGAHEFAPLGVARRPHLGSNLVLELWGPAGGQASLLVSRRPLAPIPQTTPWGEFDLDPSHFLDLGASPIGAGPPHYRSIPIPADPAYVGRSFSFQALATSTVGSPPTAYTNPVVVVVLP